MPLAANQLYEFGPYRIDPARNLLLRDAKPVPLTSKAFETLFVLVELRDRVVSKDELMSRIWPDTFVEESNLSQHISMVRRALGETAQHHHYILTLPGRGYRFTEQIRVIPGNGTSSMPDPHPAPEGGNGSAQTAAISLPAPDLLPTIHGVPRTSKVSRFLPAIVAVPLLVAAIVWLRPAARAPHVTRIRQITHIGTVIPNENLVVTGSSLYFSDIEKGENQLRSVSLDGESVFPVEKPFRTTEFFDVFPSGSELLIGEVVREFPPTSWRRALWRLPMPDGVPRRVGDLFADDAAWSPDGRTIAYTAEYDQSLNLVDGDGGNARRLASFPGAPFKPRWSPDGKLIRISVAEQAGPGTSLWQVDAYGHNVTRMLPGWSGMSHASAGQWTRDGRYFLFSGFQGGKKNIWALRDKGDFFRRAFTQPVQLTNGPLDFSLPIPSNDGKTIYAVGIQARGQLMRYDPVMHEFEPYSHGLPADHLSFSRDGRWMAYVTFPEGALVRSRLDGSEQLQLTFAPMRAYQPRWSPDGAQIAFEGTAGVDALHKVYVVSASGGSPRLATPGASPEQTISDWSSDSESLLFGTSDSSGSAWALHRLNLKTGTETVLPGTLGIGRGRLSPDGRYVAALSFLSANLLLYDVVSGTTRPLADFADYPTWSPDGKYIYYSCISRAFILAPEKTGIFRVKIADGSIERLVPAPAFPIQGNWGIWFGLTPESSLLVMRNLGTSDIYALDIDLP